MSQGMKKKARSSEFKFKVEIETIRWVKTTAELCTEYGVVSSQIFKWKEAPFIEWCKHERRYSGLDNHRLIEVMPGLKHPSYWSFKQITELSSGWIKQLNPSHHL